MSETQYRHPQPPPGLAGAGMPTTDGAGVKLTRVIGQPALPASIRS